MGYPWPPASQCDGQRNRSGEEELELQLQDDGLHRFAALVIILGEDVPDEKHRSAVLWCQRCWCLCGFDGCCASAFQTSTRRCVMGNGNRKEERKNEAMIYSLLSWSRQILNLQKVPFITLSLHLHASAEKIYQFISLAELLKMLQYLGYWLHGNN